jgi:hypothetical protein
MKSRPSGVSHDRAHHMLEHFDRHDPIELPLGIEAIHVGGDHGQIGKPARGALALDIHPLRMRI